MTDRDKGLKILIRDKARSLGFSFCGFANPTVPEETQTRYTRFIEDHGYQEMTYLRRYAPQRMDPGKLLPGVKTVIALLMNYYPAETIPPENNFILSKYAYGKDHHTVLKRRLQELTDYLTDKFAGCTALIFYDSGPMLEKFWAQRCGLGWQGKNTVIITQDKGSFFFIGIILTDLLLAPDTPGANRCGSCDRCLRACPTGALDQPYHLAISRCIAYHTIEHKKDIPVEMKGKFRDRIYGCDICQDACPFNRFATPHQETDFLPSPELVKWRKPDWLAMNETDFDRLFGKSSVVRTGYRAMKRNILFNQV